MSVRSCQNCLEESLRPVKFTVKYLFRQKAYFRIKESEKNFYTKILKSEMSNDLSNYILSIFFEEFKTNWPVSFILLTIKLCKFYMDTESQIDRSIDISFYLPS